MCHLTNHSVILSGKFCVGVQLDIQSVYYKTVILPHLNYSLLTWRNRCSKIKLLKKKAVRQVNSNCSYGTNI